MAFGGDKPSRPGTVSVFVQRELATDLMNRRTCDLVGFECRFMQVTAHASPSEAS